MSIRILGLLIALATIAAGISLDAEGKSASRSWGQASEGFQLWIRLDDKQVKVNQPILLRLSFKNMTNKVVEVREALPYHDYKIDVRDSRGVRPTEIGPLHLSSRAIGFRVQDVKVGPGQQDTVDITKLFDLSVPGTYYVKAMRRVKKRNGKGWGEVVSNKVWFTIVR